MADPVALMCTPAGGVNAVTALASTEYADSLFLYPDWTT
jgi:hypothetical protein